MIVSGRTGESVLFMALAAVGLILGHALDYMLVAGDHTHVLLAATGHGYFPLAARAAILVAVVVAIAAFASGMHGTRPGGKGQSSMVALAVRLGAIQACAFVALEVAEHLAIGADAGQWSGRSCGSVWPSRGRSRSSSPASSGCCKLWENRWDVGRGASGTGQRRGPGDAHMRPSCNRPHRSRVQLDYAGRPSALSFGSPRRRSERVSGKRCRRGTVEADGNGPMGSHSKPALTPYSGTK